jgi:lycopene beta-cyclase
MTVYKMALSGNLRTKRCDEDLKKTNDRTWVFLKEQDSIWEKSIKKMGFGALPMLIFGGFRFIPYQYNMIRDWILQSGI